MTNFILLFLCFFFSSLSLMFLIEATKFHQKKRKLMARQCYLGYFVATCMSIGMLLGNIYSIQGILATFGFVYIVGACVWKNVFTYYEVRYIGIIGNGLLLFGILLFLVAANIRVEMPQ